MRREPLAVLLAATLAATSAGAVFAQGQPESEPFGWPIQEWQRRTEADEPTLPGPKVVRKGPSSSGAVALTFDDGHNAKACASIAETLRRHGAVGTFFINGHWLKQDPNRWRRILDGMETANHTPEPDRGAPLGRRQPDPQQRVPAQGGVGTTDAQGVATTVWRLQ